MTLKWYHCNVYGYFQQLIKTMKFCRYSRTLSLMPWGLLFILFLENFRCYNNTHSVRHNAKGPHHDDKADRTRNDRDLNSYSPNPQCRLTPNITTKYDHVDITDAGRLNKTLKLSCDDCFPTGFEYLNQPVGVCDVIGGQREDNLVVLVMIMSLPADFIGRQNVRDSWVGAMRDNTAPNIRYIFLLGLANSTEEQKNVDSEQAIHNDILQKNIPEGYLLMAVKTITGLQWAQAMCSRARYIMKADADSFINVPALMSTISSVGPEVGMFGNCVIDVPIRDPKHTHHMSWENNPAPSNPPYCWGSGYVLSMAAAADVVRVAPDMKPVRMEDVYIGLCLREVRYRGNFQHRIIRMPGFYGFTDSKRPFKPCKLLVERAVWHKATPTFLKYAWDSCFKQECNLTWGGYLLYN